VDSSRLLHLLNVLEADLTGGYEDHLKSLVQAYTQVKDNPQQDNSAAVQQASEALTGSLQQSPANAFVPSWLHMLGAIGGLSFFGVNALARIREILANSTLGPVNVLNGLQEFAEELRQFRQSTSQIRKGLVALGIEPDELSEGTTEIGLILPESISKNELGALTKQLAEWNRILRTVSELAGDKEREIQIRGVATGDLEFFVVATYLTGKILGEIIGGVTSWYEKVLRIRVLRAELKAQDGPVAEVAAAEAHEKVLLDKAVQQIIAGVMSMAPATKPKERGVELEAHLEKCVRRIAILIDNGVEIEVSVPIPTVEEAPGPSDPTETDDPNATAQLEAARTARLEQATQVMALKVQGAAVARLPKIERPIFQLSEGEISEEVSKQDGGSKKATK
jgi:hypothetical protein